MQIYAFFFLLFFHFCNLTCVGTTNIWNTQIFLSFLFVFHDSFFCVHMEIGFSYWLKMRRIGDTSLLHGKKRGCRNREIGKGFSL